MRAIYKEGDGYKKNLAGLVSLPLPFVYTTDYRCSKKKKPTLSDLVEMLPDINNAVSFQVRPEYLEGLIRAFNLIEQDVSRHHSMSAIARCAQLNIYHLKVLWKIITGFSLYQYLITLRMERASELLRTTNATIKEISLLCGYRNQNDFSERFKSNFKTTPLKYRKSQIAIEIVKINT